jgi:TM2 domain-containing membrane protein YozV
MHRAAGLDSRGPPSINITNVNTVIGASQTSSKSRFTAAFIALLFGYLGFHKFYLGESGGGLFRLILSCTILGLIVTIPWAILDFFGLLFMSEQTFSRRFG